MKGRIIMIKKFFDDIRFEHGYEAVIEFDTKPDLKIGEVEVTQK